MSKARNNIEEAIQQAMKAGAFRKLSGEGKPFNWQAESLEEDDWRLAHHLLKENGYAPEFIETRQSIEKDITVARGQLKRSWDWRLQALDNGEDVRRVDAEWEKAVQLFHHKLEEINETIRDYNLAIPNHAFYRNVVNIELEMSKVKN